MEEAVLKPSCRLFLFAGEVFMVEIKNLHLDLETYSSVNLAKSGVYRYAEAPDFEVLLFGYCVDGCEPMRQLLPLLTPWSSMWR